jgi:CsoR family transcriptional regulator, copper-sensing transcriptional repressor
MSRSATTVDQAGHGGREGVRRRLVGARGHLDAVIRMIDDDRYCIDVMHQISAVQGALDGARRSLLDSHLRTCVREGLGRGSGEPVVSELVEAVFARRAPTRGDDRRCYHHASVPDRVRAGVVGST